MRPRLIKPAVYLVAFIAGWGAVMLWADDWVSWLFDLPPGYQIEIDADDASAHLRQPR